MQIPVYEDSVNYTDDADYYCSILCVYGTTTVLRAVSQTVDKRLTQEQLANFNPPFRSCNIDP